jgi:ATP-binding cassette subfamily B protein
MPRELRAMSRERVAGSGSYASFGRLLRFLWPADLPGLKLRLTATISLLGGTALLNALVPLLFAELVDRIAEPERQWPVAAGVFLTGYVGLYWVTRVLNESRWALYAPIDQRLQRNLALKALEHMHGLSLRFHLSRKPGEISRILDNGLRGLREILFDAVFLILPLALEIAFVTVVMLIAVDAVFAAVLAAALTIYGVVLVVGSERLRVYQRRAVETGTRAHGEAVDSLLNFEAVKLFGNERYIAMHYDRSLGEVETLTVRSLTYRSLLGMVMMTIIASAMGVILWLAVERARAGAMSVGELVLVNAYLLQLIRPMERLGNLYRSIKQAFVDLEQLLRLMDERAEIADRPER